MNSIIKHNSKKISTILFLIVLFVFVSVSSAYGQTVAENNSDLNISIETNSPDTIITKQEDTSANSNMNFVLWFMGSKQDPNAKITPSGTNTKKQFMTSGATPNRLLIKAFLKKAVNFESAIV